MEYIIIDLLATIFETFCCYYLLSIIIDHKVNKAKIIFICSLQTLLVFTLTFVFDMQSMLKMFITILFICITYKLLFSTTIVKTGICIILYFICLTLSENITLLILQRLNINLWIDVNGILMANYRLYLYAHIIFFLLIYLFRNKILIRFSKLPDEMNTWAILLSAIFILIFCEILYNYFMYMEKYFYIVSSIIMFAGILFITIILYFYMSKFLLFKAKEEQDHIKMEVLKQQFKYYKERAREEERIRSIYHDMKNHLLILQAEQTDTKGRKDMIQSLQEQLADYDNYIHTGNSVLDIIIRDKSREAQENNIDFSAAISYQDSNFIDPLDISTIYGNALDNAIEACAELPPEERLITVKTNRIHDMLSIIIENTMGHESANDLKTTKSDIFLHGFGLSNIKMAVEKYQGEYVTKQRNGIFTLTIIIPISA